MRILIVDDHQLFLDGLRHTLKRLSDNVEVLAENSALDAVAVLDGGTRVDLILLDMVMPGMDGPAFLQSLSERKMIVPVVVISAELEPRLIEEALQSGALGYIPKSHSAEEMLAAVRRVLDGHIYLPADVTRALGRLKRRRAAALEARESSDDMGITRRQLDVLKLMARGYSNKTIAATLHVTEHTVKSHVTVLLQVLAAENRTECVLKARRRGLIEDGIRPSAI